MTAPLSPEVKRARARARVERARWANHRALNAYPFDVAALDRAEAELRRAEAALDRVEPMTPAAIAGMRVLAAMLDAAEARRPR